MSKHRSVRLRDIASVGAAFGVLAAAPHSVAQRYDEQHTQAGDIEETNLKRALAGKQASTVADLATLIQKTCVVQPWQFTINQVHDVSVKVERSATMDARKVGCIYAVIGQSKFHATNAFSNR